MTDTVRLVTMIGMTDTVMTGTRVIGTAMTATVMMIVGKCRKLKFSLVILRSPV